MADEIPSSIQTKFDELQKIKNNLRKVVEDGQKLATEFEDVVANGRVRVVQLIRRKHRWIWRERLRHFFRAAAWLLVMNGVRMLIERSGVSAGDVYAWFAAGKHFAFKQQLAVVVLGAVAILSERLERAWPRQMSAFEIGVGLAAIPIILSRPQVGPSTETLQLVSAVFLIHRGVKNFRIGVREDLKADRARLNSEIDEEKAGRARDKANQDATLAHYQSRLATQQRRAAELYARFEAVKAELEAELAAERAREGQA